MSDHCHGTEIRVVEIGGLTVFPDILDRVPARLLRARRAFPLAVISSPLRDRIVVAMVDPGDLRALDEISFATGLRVEAVQATASDIAQALNRHFGGPQTTVRPDLFELPEDDAGSQTDWFRNAPLHPHVGATPPCPGGAPALGARAQGEPP